MSKPEWKNLYSSSNGWASISIDWCKGCGCIRIDDCGKREYLVPRREKQRRKRKRETS